MAHDENEMVPVPIPTEVPQPPRLDQLPLDILHSATVELLIQQNEDLSSRLKVNIRRNSQLELKILENEREINLLQKKRENVQAQMEIIKEKEKLWTSKKEEAEKKAHTRSQESELLELRYNELYTTSRQRSKEQRQQVIEKQQQIEKLEKRINILKRVRARAKEKLRSFLLDMAHGFQQNKKTMKRSESSQRIMQKNFEHLKSEIDDKEEFFKEQLENLKVVSQKSLQEFDAKVSHLQNKNETLVSERDSLRREISELSQALHEEKKNRDKISQISEELDSLRNQRISYKREMQAKAEEADSSRQNEQRKFVDLQKQFDELNKQFAETKTLLSVCEDNLLKTNKENRELSEQLDSVQSLWIETQSRLEKEELRSQSLEKINRQLSHQAKNEKIERATQRAHSPEPTNDEGEISEEDREFQDKIKTVFASQYGTMSKGPELDV